MEKNLIHNDIDLEAALIIAGIIYKPYASLEAQKRSEEFTAEQIQLIKKLISNN